MASTNFNLMAAEAAVDYVGQKVRLGASNKPIDLTHAKMKHNSQCFWNRLLSSPKLKADSVEKQRKTISGAVGASGNSIVETVLAVAKEVERTGIGNCGEQSSVAFRYLYDRKDVNEFALAKLGGNHEFVIIGAPSSVLNGVYPVAIPPGWPTGTVVCDPWYHEWFVVERDWPGKARSILAETEPGWVQHLVKVQVVAAMNWQPSGV